MAWRRAAFCFVPHDAEIWKLVWEKWVSAAGMYALCLLCRTDRAAGMVQVEQGLGVGTNRPVFNRHRLSWTRFQPLEAVAHDSRKTPKVVVLHAGCGGCIGDVLPYDLFTLGGPYSVSPPVPQPLLLRRHTKGRNASRILNQSEGCTSL